jgi:hypothetical protein
MASKNEKNEENNINKKKLPDLIEFSKEEDSKP